MVVVEGVVHKENLLVVHTEGAVSTLVAEGTLGALGVVAAEGHSMLVEVVRSMAAVVVRSTAVVDQAVHSKVVVADRSMAVVEVVHSTVVVVVVEVGHNMVADHSMVVDY